jgi:5-methylcytosine-specific restriction endonuclease McrA
VHETIKECKENITDVLRWLLTGDIHHSHYINNINYEKEVKSVSILASTMRKRFRRSSDKGRTNPLYAQDLPTTDQIKRLFLRSGCKCQVTGWVYQRGISGQKTWSMTFDHVVSVSRPPPGMNPWFISNIQVMCCLLNQIKGNHPDGEVERWFRVWKAYNM